MEGGTAPATLIFFIYRELEGSGRSVGDLGTKPNDIADLKYIGAFLSIKTKNIQKNPLPLSMSRWRASLTGDIGTIFWENKRKRLSDITH